MGHRPPTPDRTSKALPPILLIQTCWVTKDTEAQITYHCGDEDAQPAGCVNNISRHLRVHLPQHFITTFCPTRYDRLSQGLAAPKSITHGPVLKPPGYKKPRTILPTGPIPHPRTLLRVVLWRLDTQPRKRSLSLAFPTDKKRWWQSSSPSRHFSLSRNLRMVEQRTLEKEVHRLVPRIAAAASELKALRDSMA